MELAMGFVSLTKNDQNKTLFKMCLPACHGSINRHQRAILFYWPHFLS